MIAVFFIKTQNDQGKILQSALVMIKLNYKKMQQEQSYKKDMPLNNLVKKIESKSKTVNMRNLLNRYKKERAKEKTETAIFVSLAFALLVISGLIISL